MNYINGMEYERSEGGGFLEFKIVDLIWIWFDEKGLWFNSGAIPAKWGICGLLKGSR